MEQALAHLTDRIVAVSEQIKRDLVAYGVAPPEKIAVIPLGFDLSPFVRAQSHRGEFRRELGLNGSVRLVGIVGRIFPIKNHRLFLEAAAQVAAQEPATHFVIVGDGLLRAEMEHYARALGIADRVIFTGWRRDLPRIYADLDVLVVSSDNEGTPVSAIEAMASGCPVVATRVGGLPDLITEGETGYLVPPRDAEKLALAIIEVLQSPEKARLMGGKARDFAHSRFNLQRLIMDMEMLYSNLLQQKNVDS